MAVQSGTCNLVPSAILDGGPPEQGDTPVTKKKEMPFCANLKVFLAALSFVYFTKAFSGGYMKSSITQIERRFDIPSSTVGAVDSSFEMGNLLMIAFASYFGGRWHRPRLIAVGCLIMSVGSFLTALPHFFMGYYRYETAVTSDGSANISTASVSPPCRGAQHHLNASNVSKSLEEMTQADCEQVAGSNVWIYVLLGNLLRGIGETPITPLGISYLDDFAKAENTAFYIACIHTIAIIGPVLGFMLGSLCANMYVDIGFVDVDAITITPQDSRWVGAWWLGFLVAGAVTLLSAIPFFFLPRSLIKEGDDIHDNSLHEDTNLQDGEQRPLQTDKPEQVYTYNSEGVAGFFLALKRLFCNPIFPVYLITCLLQYGSYVGFSTYKPKYLEQQYGQSTSKSNFIMGVTSLPALAAGVFLGGIIMKKCKMNIVGAAKFAVVSSVVASLLTVSFFAMGCQSSNVAGLTVTFHRNQIANLEESSSISTCNSRCNCKTNEWDPVCGENGKTYVSACLAGCTLAAGSGKNTVYHNCSCIEDSGSQSHNQSAVLGECPREEKCETMLTYFLIVDVIASFLFAVGGTPAYMVVFRAVDPDLKSLAIGVYTLVMRTLAGIPAPIYFGALIDQTCLLRGSKTCGGIGACRIYNATSYRKLFLGLTAGMRGLSLLLSILIIIMLKKKFTEEKVASHDVKDVCDQNEDCSSNSIDYLEVSTNQETIF